MNRKQLWITLDSYKRQFFLRSELKKKLLKSVKVSNVIPYWRRYYSSYLYSKLPRLSAKTISVNRCINSGRVWSVSKHTHYSRFVLRSETMKSNIPGCSRASW